MAKTAYTWDPFTGEAKGVKIARNKSDQGEILLPGNATWEKPPVVGEDRIAIWTGKSWDITADYRKKTFYDTETGAALPRLEIGHLPAENMTQLQPPACTVWDGKAWIFDEKLWLEAAIRPERDGRLAGTDWSQLADSPLTAEKRQEYADYRKELRDLPATISFVDPEFPKEPA